MSTFAKMIYRQMPWLLAAVIIIGFGIFSLRLGQDANYDLKNYHYYNVYALFNDRYGKDILPANFIQSFHNPTLDIPIYLAQIYLSPRLGGFLLGALQSLNVIFVYLIARRFFAAAPPPLARVLPLLTTAIGATSPLFISEIGTTYGDNLTSIAILAGLWLCLIDVQSRRVSFRTIAGGASVGLAVGLKLTSAPFAVGLIVAIGVAAPACGLLGRLRSLIGLGIGLAGGFLLAAGHWMAFLYGRFGNPLFPYYNHLFQSPYAQPINWRDLRWVGNSLFDLVRYPLAWITGGDRPSSELHFIDPRWIFLIFLGSIVLLTTIVRIRQRRSSHSALQPDAAPVVTHVAAERFLLTFVFAGYVVWLYQFGYSRYLIPLDLISGIALWLLLMRLPVAHRWQLGLGIILSCLAILSVRTHPNWGRVAWTSSWFDVRLNAIPDLDRAQVIVASNEPLAYVAPFFPPEVRFLRVRGPVWEMNTGRFEAEVAAAVTPHPGVFYALVLTPAELADAKPVLAGYGLAAGDPAGCYPLPTKFETALLCPLHRL